MARHRSSRRKSRKSTISHVRKAIANPKSADSIWLMLFGFMLFGFFSGVGSAIANKFVAKTYDKTEKAAQQIEQGVPPNVALGNIL